MTGRGKGRQEAQYGLLTSIAAEAGVSLSTVSKVVHRRRDVGAATRDQVEGLLARYGYVRPWERGPATPRQIIVVFRDLSGPYTLEVARGIVDAAGELGIDVVTGTTSRRSISGWLEECVALGAAGLVIVISMLAEEDQRRIVEQRLPVVLIDPLSAPSEDIPSIGVTNWSGAREAVQHLLELGHTRIGMVAGRSHSLAGAARLHGYRAALEEAGIDYDPAVVRSTDFDYDEALAASLQILRADDPPTAVFAASDAQALGVLEAARQQGLAVPDDLADATLPTACLLAGTLARNSRQGQGREIPRLRKAFANFLPARGSASGVREHGRLRSGATVMADTQLCSADGVYSGAVTASGDGQCAAVVYREVESHTLTLVTPCSRSPLSNQPAGLASS